MAKSQVKEEKIRKGVKELCKWEKEEKDAWENMRLNFNYWQIARKKKMEVATKLKKHL